MSGNSLADLMAEFPQTAISPAFSSGLQTALAALSTRGLVLSSRWAAELLSSLPPSPPPPPPPPLSPTLLLAKSIFDTRQYRRCASTLARSTSSDATSKFLRCYATYLCAEADKTNADAALRGLREDLCRAPDAHCKYLHAVVLERLDLGREDGVVRRLLIDSVVEFPWNWGVWERLAKGARGPDEARQIVEAICAGDSEGRGVEVVGRRVFCVLFWAWTCRENDGAEEARVAYGTIVGVLERSLHFKGCLATALYHLRLFDEAQDLFEEVFAADGDCLEGVDTYSNILYVKEDKARLSVLAQRCVKVDKYCVETCCVIGNYYSLRGQHDQAVSYFQRALKLNPAYLSAWTLMGHEYVELKNAAAAVEAYRRAVDVSPKDFRAWYGLGQTYELLDMPQYTLYYYSKAASLRPKDARMWSAVGQTYEELKRLPDAVRAFERANACDENGDGQALAQLADLYERLSREDVPQNRQEHVRLAVHYHKANLARRDEEGLAGVKTAGALHYLAVHAMEEKKFERAEQYLIRLLDYAGRKDEAKSMLGDIKAARNG